VKTGRPAGVAIRRAAGSLLAALLLGRQAALAYVQTNLVDQGFGDIGLRIVGGNLTLRLEQDASFRITDGTDLTALTDSMARWTNVATSNANVSEGARFNFANPIDAGAGQASDGVNRVYFAETDSGGLLGNAIAISFFWVGSGGAITDCDIIFNERIYTFSTTTPANPNQDLGPNVFDLGEIATHEMGHCLGLDHTAVAGRFSSATGLQVSGFSSGDFASQGTMYPYGSGTIQGRSLSQDDTSGVSFIYPNSTLASTRATISGRVLDGGDFTKIKGAHVVAVSTAAPDIPVVGALSDVQEGGPGGEYTLVGLAPGSYYVRLEPMVGTSNPFTAANTHFTGFDTNFPWEYYNGSLESGSDNAADRTTITVVAGQTITGIDILTNVGAPDPNEPNNTRASATPFACEQMVTASIVPLGDIDYYAVAITSPTAFDVDIDASVLGSPLDAILGVFDAAGTLLAFNDNSSALDPFLSVDLVASGTYYIAVGSFDDGDFNGTGAHTVGNYTLTLGCSVPEVPAGTCAGRVLYAASNQNGTIMAIADADRDLRFDGQTTFSADAGLQLGLLASRRDGGVCVGAGNILASRWDDTGDFIADRSAALNTGLPESQPVVAFRRGGAEYLYTGDLFGGGTVLEYLDTGGGFTPERSTVFTTEPESVMSLAVDEAGTLYVLDVNFNFGVGAILAYRDTDGDGDADVSRVFLDGAAAYGGIVGRRPGEVYAADDISGKIDRILDTNGDLLSDSVTTYATGLALNTYYGLAFDDLDILYAVEGGNRVLALPDDNRDYVADRQVQFSGLISGLTGIAFGPGPPETVSPPSSFHPVTVTPNGSALRLTWEDQGPTVPAYNIYEGTLGSYYSHAILRCGVTGTADGAGSRSLDITPSGTGNHYYLVTSSDSCGEGSPGRSSDGRRRPLPAPACGAAP
jgi:hypothetical protein